MTDLTPKRRAENMRKIAVAKTTTACQGHEALVTIAATAALNDLPLYEAALAKCEDDLSSKYVLLEASEKQLDQQSAALAEAEMEIERLNKEIDTIVDEALEMAGIDMKAANKRLAEMISKKRKENALDDLTDDQQRHLESLTNETVKIVERELNQQAAEIERLKAERALSIDREHLGQLVRIAWMKWAKQQPDCKPSWTEPWEELPERIREVDRQIGEFVASQCVTPELLRVESECARLRTIIAEALRMVGEIATDEGNLKLDPYFIDHNEAVSFPLGQALVQLANKLKEGTQP
jgi:transposase